MSTRMGRRLARRAKAQGWLKKHQAKRLELLLKASGAKASGASAASAASATHVASAASETERNVGTNGTAQIAPGCSGSDLLELFNQLNRGVDSASVRSCVDTIIAKAFGGSGDAGVDVRILVDLFVLTFQTRDCRGGKGERKLFRVLLLALYEHFPLAVIGALPLIVEYGYFKDFQGIYEDAMVSPEPARFAGLAAAVVDVVVKYLRQDRDILEAAERDMTQPTGLSLAGKYVPRINEPKRNPEPTAKANPEPTAKAIPEPKRKPKRPQLCRASEASSAALVAGLASSAAPSTTARGLQLAFARAVRDKLFTDPLTGTRPADASRQYRKLLSRLNEQLRTVESLMCTRRWDEIEVKRIPSLCLKRSRGAFLFEDNSGKIVDPTNDVRVALRQRLLDPKEGVNIKGGQLHAHQIVQECMKNGSVSEGAAQVLEAQWQSIVRTVQQHIDEFAQQQQAAASSSASSTAGGGGGGGGGGAAGGGGGADTRTKKTKQPTFSLGKLVALVDVSLSMAGTPMQVAVALGLLVSQLATPLFRGRVLTFESTPRWHQVEGADVVAKVKNLLRAPAGYSTNFAAAMALILKAVEDLAMRTKQMPVVPDLIVFSDMQFDAANGGGVWDTAHETICHNFADLGQRLRAAGVAGLPADDGPLQPPVMTFWNLKAETTGMVASANTKGVRLLSGFSQSLLKLVLAGVLPEASDADANPDAVDPLSTLRAALDDQRYDAVRVYLAGRTDAPFAEYEFAPPVKTGKEGTAGVGGGGK